MNLQQAADYFHLTKQALYQRIAKEGRKPQDLRQPNGQLTEQGFKWISDRYARRRDDAEVVTPQDATIKQLQEDLAAAEARLKESQATADRYKQAAEATAEQLAKAKADAEIDTAAMKEKLEKAQLELDEVREEQKVTSKQMLTLSMQVAGTNAQLAQMNQKLLYYLTGPAPEPVPQDPQLVQKVEEPQDSQPVQEVEAPQEPQTMPVEPDMDNFQQEEDDHFQEDDDRNQATGPEPIDPLQRGFLARLKYVFTGK